MTNAPDVTLEGGYISVNAELIEARLNEIWGEATGTPDDLPFVKLCLANILVVSDADSRLEAEHLTQQLAIRHPSRMLMIVIDETLSTYSAFVRTACELNPEVGAYVCWEIVEILSDTPRAVHIGGAVRSLLIDSVPVVTIDLRAFQSTPAFDRDLHDLSDYYFVQADVVPATMQFKGFMPLAWYRTLPVRELIGEAVGLLIQQKEFLPITSVTLFYRDGGARLDPLLAGWFVGRLADDATLSTGSAGVEFECRGFPGRLDWTMADSSDNRIARLILGNDEELTITVERGLNHDHPVYVATHAKLRLEQSGAGPDLVTYVLAAIGDDTEFKEYAAVHRISTRLPIP
jgi:glucose-6-phosphate dehydrogenase assembly protein OpcA